MIELHQQLFLFIYQWLGPASVLTPLTVFIAQWFPWVVGAFPFVYELYVRDEGRGFSRTLTRIYAAPFLVYAVTVVIKYLFPVFRPFATLEIPPAFTLWSDPYGLASFPSSHTAFFAALAITMYFCNHQFGKWFLGFAVVIGLARVGAGVHWPLDILGGFLIGVTLGYILERGMLFYWRRDEPRC